MTENVTEGTELAEELAEKIDNIPSLPEVSDKVIRLIDKQDVPIERLERLIKTDPSLTGRILQLANSRYYGHEREVTSLEQAIKLLGFNTLRSIVVSHGMENEYSAPEVSYFPREEFWDYSMATGIAGEIIADYLGLGSEKKGEIFSAGHLHAIGRTIIDQYLHREFVKITKYVKEKEARMYEAEKEILNVTHCEIGASVLDDWNLPDTIVKSARYYYEPGEIDIQTVDAIHLASVLTKTKNYGFSGDNDLSYLKEDRVEQLGISDEDIQTILKEDFPEKYDLY